MDMGQKIKTLREQKGMTLEELGTKVGVGKSTIRKWETGMIANMRRDKIAKIANALDVTPSYLMGWDNLSEPSSPLSTVPDELLNSFNRLNDLGKKEAVKRVNELSEISRYVN